MLKFIIGVVLFWSTVKLARYLREIVPAYNRPILFRNTVAFSVLNILIVILPIIAFWFVLAGLFSFRSPFWVGG
ncbi:MAG: hypothetical protein AB7Q97_23375 [Gammaproteobacteria bacterium]